MASPRRPGRPCRRRSGVCRWPPPCRSGVRCGWRPGCRCWPGGSRTPGGCWPWLAGLTGAGERAAAVAPRLRAGPAALLRGDRFDLDALDDATAQAEGLVAELGGGQGPAREGPRRPARTRGRRDPPLGIGPAGRGHGPGPPAGRDPRRPCRRRRRRRARRVPGLLHQPGRAAAGRGVPLAVGRSSSTRAWSTCAPPTAGWPRPCATPGHSANFPTSGKAMLRAVQARGRPRPDGVIALDPLAMRMPPRPPARRGSPATAASTPPAPSAKLTRDADLRWPDQDERRRYHQAVLATLVARFLSGNDLVAYRPGPRRRRGWAQRAGVRRRPGPAADAGRSPPRRRPGRPRGRRLPGRPDHQPQPQPGRPLPAPQHPPGRASSPATGRRRSTRTVKVVNAVPAGRSAGTLATHPAARGRAGLGHPRRPDGPAGGGHRAGTAGGPRRDRPGPGPGGHARRRLPPAAGGQRRRPASGTGSPPTPRCCSTCRSCGSR